MTRASLDCALRYADRGWAVFPCHEPTRTGCSCRRPNCSSPAKHPRTARGLHDATTDPEVIARWWRRWPAANVAVRTGADSGLVVIDVDPKHGGFAAIAELQRGHGEFPPTPAARTGSGGRHYWFVHPGLPVPNSAGRLGPGIDVRGDGGYVIAPPSLHPSGSYVWEAAPPLAELPAWVLDLARTTLRPRPATTAEVVVHDAGPWARAALAGELGRVRGSAPGSRNNTLNRAAFALGQLVGGGHLSDDQVRCALVEAGLSCGLRPHEATATVASGLCAGKRSPRHPRAPDLDRG